MKAYIYILAVIYFFCSNAFAATELYENPFISKTEAQVAAVSAATGLVVPSSYMPLVSSIKTNAFYSQVNTPMGANLNIPSQRLLYKNAPLYSRIRIAEKIGDQGAIRYAKKMGFESLYKGRVGQGKGFDQVYRSGKQVVVIEAKGGSSPLKTYHGYTQGTAKYTLKVANATLKSQSASSEAKKAASEVIDAHKKGNLVVQVSRTKHVYGEASEMTIETIHGKLTLPNATRIAHQTGVKAGLLGAGIVGAFDLIHQASNGKAIDWKQAGTITALGGVSGYAGAFSGTLIQHSLIRSEAKLLSSLISHKTGASLIGGIGGGFVSGAVFSYGAYLLGYGDFKTANRNMISSAASYGALALGGAALGGVAGTAFATSIAGMIGATASTGTAIASLSGAAAANATLAALGGGTLAAGGGGVAAGTVVLGGISATGVGLLAVGVGAGVMYLYQLGDEKTEQQRVEHLLANVQNHVSR